MQAIAMMEEIMTDKSKVLDDLRREVGRIAAGGGAWQDITKPTDYRAFEPAPKDARLKVEGRTATPAERGPFGRWLVRQPEVGLGAKLIRSAKADPKWPLNGDPEAARTRLRECGADGNMFAAIDDAELDWLSI